MDTLELNGFETLTKFSNIDRSVLEKRALMLEKIELLAAAWYWGCSLGAVEDMNCIVHDFETANFENYFNQRTFKEKQ